MVINLMVPNYYYGPLLYRIWLLYTVLYNCFWQPGRYGYSTLYTVLYYYGAPGLLTVTLDSGQIGRRPKSF